MDSLMYREIINTHLFPSVAKNFNYKAELHQDNDRKHTSIICTRDLENFVGNRINNSCSTILGTNDAYVLY